MKSHLEECHDMSDVELHANMRNDPRLPLWPAAQVLLDRAEVKPLRCEPAPTPTKPKERCEWCCGAGKTSLGGKCNHCGGKGEI